MRGPWQPKAWTSHPEDASSEPVDPKDCFIDFSVPFTIMEVRVGFRFWSCRVRLGMVDGLAFHGWINVAKLKWVDDGQRLAWQPWVRAAPARTH